MYERCHTSNHLVGGRGGLGLPVGLWCWTMNNTSSNVAISLGARLIILRYSLWDLMCSVLVFFFAYPLLLSAVDMIMVYQLAWGFGVSLTLPLLCGLPSVLDFLETSKVGVWGRPASHKKNRL